MSNSNGSLATATLESMRPYGVSLDKVASEIAFRRANLLSVGTKRRSVKEQKHGQNNRRVSHSQNSLKDPRSETFMAARDSDNKPSRISGKFESPIQSVKLSSDSVPKTQS